MKNIRFFGEMMNTFGTKKKSSEDRKRLRAGLIDNYELLHGNLLRNLLYEFIHRNSLFERRLSIPLRKVCMLNRTLSHPSGNAPKSKNSLFIRKSLVWKPDCLVYKPNRTLCLSNRKFQTDIYNVQMGLYNVQTGFYSLRSGIYSVRLYIYSGRLWFYNHP